MLSGRFRHTWHSLHCRLKPAVVLLTVLLMAISADLALAYEVLVVQSRREPAFEEMLAGFRAVHAGSERVLVLSDYAEVDLVRMVREDRPSIVVTIGDSALAAVRKVRSTPVLALMALGIHTAYGAHPNLRGVGLFVPPEKYLGLFQSMRKHRVGVLYHPARSGWYLRTARQLAQRMEIELVLREVSSPRQALSQLDSLKGVVDALWMLPDSSAVTRETVEAYLRFSQEQRVPLVSFASVYLGMGAAAVLELDRYDIGRQAGEMAQAILRGTDIAELPVGMPRRSTLKINPSVLKHLDIPPEILEHAMARE